MLDEDQFDDFEGQEYPIDDSDLYEDEAEHIFFQ